MAETPVTEKPQYVATTGASRIDDPNVRIPKVIKQSGANADAIHAHFYGGANAEATPPEAAAAPPQGTVPDNTPAPAPQAPPPATQEDWEHKFNSVNGRYVKSQQTIQNLTQRLSDLESALADRDARAAQPKQPDLPPSQITPQEVEDYGEEFLNVVGKKAREIAAGEVAQLKDQIANLTAQLNGVTTNVVRNAKEKMMDVLDRDVPTWRQVNENPDFMTWLGLNEPYSGIIRNDILQSAWKSNDTVRVKALFNGFITDEAATTPRPSQPAPTPESKPQLTQFAAPGRASSSGDANPSPAPSKPIITRAQIAQFHSDVSRGKYRGREAEQKAFDVAMIEAAREGRIQ